MSLDDIDPGDTFDQDRAEVWHVRRSTGCTEAEALAITRPAVMRICDHGHPIDVSACPQCPCPAGGAHHFAEQDSGDAYKTVHRWWACDECGAQPQTTEEEL